MDQRSNGRMTNTLLVSFDRDPNNIDTAVLIVGIRTADDTVDIINAFQGKEAEMIFLNLVTQKKNLEDGNDGHN